MSIQLSLFPTERDVATQRRLLQELIALKADAIQTKLYHNFWGTPEACRARRAEAQRMAESFAERVDRAFPGIL